MPEPKAQPVGPGAIQDLTGTTVGRFAVRARLGAGGMGEVYRADDTTLKRPVALKRLPPHLGADPRYRQRLLKEAERASALTHQHIAGVYDVVEDRGELFLVMEYVEGTTLRERLREPFELGEFLKVAVQCAEALVAAQEKGIVHRDIKPENIMLMPTGQVKILDFGVARRLPRSDEGAVTETSDSTSTTGISGTPAYMAPEMLLEREPDSRADIFSLGVVFYEALAGRHPFRAKSFVAIADRILHEAPPPVNEANPKIPAELDRIVGKMLAKDPEERYATAADLLVDLRAVQQAVGYPGLLPAQGAAVYPTPRPAPLPAVRRKYTRLSQALTLAVVLVLVAVVFWRLFKPAAPTERIRVAVLPFANRTGDERLDQFRLTMTQMLVLDLTGSPNIQVLSYERLLEITQGFKAEGKDISSPEAIQAIAEYSNSQFVVVPAMFAMGNTLRMSAEFRDAKRGEAVSAASAERVLSGSAEETLYSMLGELADGIQQYFKSIGRGENYQARPEASRPKTATVAFHFTEGKNALAQGNYTKALDSFQQVVKQEPGFALAYAWMGQIYGLLGYDDRARELSERAAQLITAQTPVTDAYFIEANLAERKYDYSAAEQKYRALIRLYPDEAAWHNSLAAVHEKQGQYQKAIASYHEALVRDSNYIVVYQKLASLYSKTRDFPEALSQAQKALSLYRALGNREGEASTLVDLGKLFRVEGEYQRAREYSESALQLFKTLRNEFGVIQATRLLGDIRASEGELQEARRYYQQVLSASGEIQNNRLIVGTLMNMGVTYLQEGNYSKAVGYFERSLAQAQLYGEYRDWPALRERAEALTNLGSVFIEYGPDPERGLRYVQEALSIFRTMGDARWEAGNQMVVGLFYMNAGKYDEGMQHLQQSLALYRSIDYKKGIAQSNYNVGRCYFFQNQYERALDSVGNALALFQGLQDPFRLAMSQILLGWTYRRLGDSAQARALLEEGLQAAQKKGYGELLPDAYNALGEVYRDRGETERARHSFQKASALWTETNVSESSIEARSNLGLLEAESGNFGEGLSYCRAAVARARKLQRVHTLARTLVNLARVSLLRKDYASAIQAFDELLSLGEQALGLELRAQAYYIRSKALEGLGRTDEARGSAQKARQAIRQLQQMLAAGHRETFGARPDIQVLFP